ncbi:hypothetical protein E1956_41630 [Paraburkholderia pallida]|uniref:Uncharacterized protein n=1 Tax=Paraburkholderia pallida TaxID=2547399 RepID=A0A4P7D991_9BURK|nr:hypothetical protein E1956_41630 [Paraburkholderia pallida]
MAISSAPDCPARYLGVPRPRVNHGHFRLGNRLSGARDSAESRKMSSGSPLDEAAVQLQFDATETLEEALSDFADRE